MLVSTIAVVSCVVVLSDVVLCAGVVVFSVRAVVLKDGAVVLCVEVLWF